MCIAARRPRLMSMMTMDVKHHHRQIMSSSASPAVIVQHNYHDHAGELPPPNQELNLPATAVAPFPIKLHEVLSQIEADGLDHVVSWQPHGRCFVIHRPSQFKEILPTYFPTMGKMASFQRQLNLYGFQRITQGLDKSAYYNEFFLRDRVFLTSRMQRIKVKGTGVRGKSNPEQEPNFYNMPFVQPLVNTMAAAPVVAASSAVVMEDSPLRTVSSCSSMESSCSASSPPQHSIVEQRHEDELPLSEWGMPFFALDDVPSIPVAIASDPSLQSMIAHMTHSNDSPHHTNNSNDNSINCEDDDDDDLADILEQVVSWEAL